MKDSVILPDSLFLYGVDYMSTDDVKRYLKNYAVESSKKGAPGETKNPESISSLQEPPQISNAPESKEIQIKWINDSSCVVQMPSEKLARKAFEGLRLSSKRMDDELPPLTLYLEDL